VAVAAFIQQIMVFKVLGVPAVVVQEAQLQAAQEAMVQPIQVAVEVVAQAVQVKTTLAVLAVQVL
jgi:hypothetical protein